MATILDSLVESCANKLQEIITEEAIPILSVKEELRELQERIKQIQCLISDAEQRGTNDSIVHNWFSSLKDAMYDADDIIDLASFEGSKLLGDHYSSGKAAVCSGLSLLTCFSNIQVRHEIGNKIRNLNRKIEKITKDKIVATLEDKEPSDKGSTSEPRKSAHIVEPNLVGKEIVHSCRKLVNLVLRHKEEKTYKLAIVGTGGIGKTTLAQKVYNDNKLKQSFNKHAWIYVSRDYSPVSLLRELLRTMEVHHTQEESVEELQNKLESAIKDQSIFLVLDDLWRSNVWVDLLRAPLHAAATGIILVTTRDETVAREIGVNLTHRVNLMSLDVGWELLCKSMNIQDVKEVQNLQDIGVEIVQKLGGLPLAINVVARVLASKDQTEIEWRNILTTNVWSMSNLPKEISGGLYLSYDDLPQHLRQCFLYCIVFPEDRVLDRDNLIRMWVAEGFVKVDNDKLLEDIAEEYYHELISRNILHPVFEYYDRSICKMHGLLRQLACHLSTQEFYIGDPESLVDNTICKLRRMLVTTEKDTVVIPSMGKEEIKLRTFKSNGKPWGIENTFFMKLKYLRVLDLSDSLVQSVPDYVKNLIHLRSLDLDGTLISCLPESIGALKHLQMLNLQRCESLHSLPRAITQLCKLRRLGLDGTPINQVPKGIGRLKYLNDLQGFPIGGGSDDTIMQDGWDLHELAHLSNLWKLDLKKLERATPSSSADSLSLMDKGHLKVLKLWCTELEDEAYSEESISNVEMIFEQLTPPDKLEELVIVAFFGRKLPTWLGTSDLSSLKYLNIEECKSCADLPSMGHLPNLEYLKIAGATSITKIGPEFVGHGVRNVGSTDEIVFPKLEWLIINNMPNWKEWSFIEEEEEMAPKEGGEDGAVEKQKGSRLFPCLRKLDLLYCPKLRALPWQLGQQATNLNELIIYGASWLKKVEDLPFLDKAQVETCARLERVSNLSQLRKLYIRDCVNLRCVQNLGNLEHLLLDEDMQELSSLWVPGLQEQRCQLHGDELEVHEWLGEPID
ncbi:putative disease resistance protein RGA4 [Oryza brachyantha]|uniref:Uncharacterized protein n=1 Tax=Oryza brachyantha TaxID=4533 RepID=J3NA66_ORYBR|nr:putative disease resistance protein RGA4 [Oryza brachyantha]